MKEEAAKGMDGIIEYKNTSMADTVDEFDTPIM